MKAWISNTPSYVATLPIAGFPFDRLPEGYVPERTVLKLAHGVHAHTYLWCYLERRPAAALTKWNPASLSPARVAALPKVIERLSKWCRFNALRAVSVGNCFRSLSQFICWADGAEHQGKFEPLLADADLATEALKAHHTYLRQLLQANRIGRATAVRRDHHAINILSQIHDRTSSDEIEALSDLGGGGTKAPQEQEVMQFMSTLQTVFDSVARQILRDGDDMDAEATRRCVIRMSAASDARPATLPQSYAEDRLMELACVAFAGLAIGDSGANLAQIQAYEEPADLLEQLAQPDRLNLIQKAIKFRAGGKPVPVHLTTITLSRLRAYLKIRERLVARLNGRDIAPMFVQCAYCAGNDRSSPRKPRSVRALASNFLSHLRCKMKSIGSELPPVTLRQLRTYKQQHLVRKHGVKVAAETMGHSVTTAIAKYCKAQESVRDNEMGQFLKTLTSTVLVPASSLPEAVPTVRIAVGSCKEESFFGYAMGLLFSDENFMGRGAERMAETVSKRTRHETLQLFKQGKLAYRETVLGGCVSTDECKARPLEAIPIGCLESNCVNLVVSSKRLDHVIRSQEMVVAMLERDEPGSVEFRLEADHLRAMLKACQQLKEGKA